VYQISYGELNGRNVHSVRITQAKLFSKRSGLSFSKRSGFGIGSNSLPVHTESGNGCAHPELCIFEVSKNTIGHLNRSVGKPARDAINEFANLLILHDAPRCLPYFMQPTSMIQGLDRAVDVLPLTRL